MSRDEDRDRAAMKEKAHRPDIEEVLMRKRIAENPADLKSWSRLFNAVYQQRNIRELSILTRTLSEMFAGNARILEFCLGVQISAHLMDDACASAKTLDELSALEKIQSRRDIYYLQSIFKITGSGTAIPSLDTTDNFIRRFNDPVLNSPAAADIDVVCFLQHQFHLSIQQRVAEHLRDKGFNVIFSEADWVVSAVKPKVLLTSEALYGKLEVIRREVPDCLIVNTRHGLGDKNHAALGASHADRICVSSDEIASLFMKTYLVAPEKIWVTGFPLMDEVFENTSIEIAGNRPSARKEKVVLFAPTFTPHLSAAFFLADDIVRNIRGDNSDIHIIIKPHPHLLTKNQTIIQAWTKAAAESKNVSIELNASVNAMSLFDRADLLISDVSSVALAWMAVDKPLICVIDEQSAKASSNYASDGIEWQMLKHNRTVNDTTQLSAAVAMMLNEDRSSQTQRREFANILFGDLRDGRSAWRISEKIGDFLGGMQR